LRAHVGDLIVMRVPAEARRTEFGYVTCQGGPPDDGLVDPDTEDIIGCGCQSQEAPRDLLQNTQTDL